MYLILMEAKLYHFSGINIINRGTETISGTASVIFKENEHISVNICIVNAE